MKIVIQNTETQHYLSAGRWVSAADDADDFVAILRAYKFAREHTSGHFQIVLYCPEDEYVTNIIDGMGMRPAKTMAAANGIQLPVYLLDAKGKMTGAVSTGASKAADSETVAGPEARFQLN
jgi:hypothetical protein